MRTRTSSRRRPTDVPVWQRAIDRLRRDKTEKARTGKPPQKLTEFSDKGFIVNALTLNMCKYVQFGEQETLTMASASKRTKAGFIDVHLLFQRDSNGLRCQRTDADKLVGPVFKVDERTGEATPLEDVKALGLR